ncbi:unnamed protein product [Cunninghamella blakesleeana]
MANSTVASNASLINAKPTNVKLVLLGESAVGKSSLVVRFVNKDFSENKEPTIGAAFLTQKCHLGDRTIKFEIWDTAGQERFHSLAPMYYRCAQAAVVVYDVTKSATLEKAKSWVKELQRQANQDIIIALVGNKLDIVTEDENERQVDADDARAYAEEFNLLFFETSAKTGEYVNDVFAAIGAKIPLEFINSSRNGSRQGGSGHIEITQPTTQTSGSCAC